MSSIIYFYTLISINPLKTDDSLKVFRSNHLRNFSFKLYTNTQILVIESVIY